MFQKQPLPLQIGFHQLLVLLATNSSQLIQNSKSDACYTIKYTIYCF